MIKKNQQRLLYWLAVIIFLIFTLGPIIWAIVISLTPENEQLASNLNILPSRLDFSNYAEIFNPESNAHESLAGGLLNSLTAAFLTILIGVPITFFTAYAFFRYKFRLKNFLLAALMLTMVIPVFATIVPIYTIFASWGWLDDLKWIAVIYVTAFLPLNTWIIYNYFNALPVELFEAAEMEGASEWQLLKDIILPLSVPILFTSLLLMFLSSWSQYQIPMILSSTDKSKVVTLVMADFMGRDTIQYGMIAASGILTIIPPVIIAIVFRRQLVAGLSQGSVKG